jgi:hypothetical protein
LPLGRYFWSDYGETMKKLLLLAILAGLTLFAAKKLRES